MQVAGIEVHVHGHIRSSASAQNILLFLVHGRLQSSAGLSAPLADKILASYTGAATLLIVHWDQQNHGKRIIDEKRNYAWNEGPGNEHHAVDMLSVVSAGVEEAKLISDYLPCLLPLQGRITKVISGVSMGGHVAIRSAAKYPGVWDAAMPIVGCFDLTSLLLNRLYCFNTGELYEKSYSEVAGQVRDNIPEALFNIVSNDDKKVLNEYTVKTLALFGEQDTVVPPQYSAIFFHEHMSPLTHSLHSDHYIQGLLYPAGHQVTDDMIKDIVSWLKHL